MITKRLKPLIVALDIDNGKKAISIAKMVAPWVDLFKIGPILFLNQGPSIVESIKKLGKEVFLDLKFHDIPQTVKRSVEAAFRLGVYSVTIHSLGGQDMIKTATDIFPRPKIWAVTILTSQIVNTKKVINLAKIAKSCGADGVISSPLEIKEIKKNCGKDFNVITPGIRITDSVDDQKRLSTPEFAIQNGADFIVVGRPIIESSDPIKVVKDITDRIQDVYKKSILKG